MPVAVRKQPYVEINHGRRELLSWAVSWQDQSQVAVASSRASSVAGPHFFEDGTQVLARRSQKLSSQNPPRPQMTLKRGRWEQTCAQVRGPETEGNLASEGGESTSRGRELVIKTVGRAHMKLGDIVVCRT